MHEWVNDWMNESMTEWMNKDEWMNEWMNNSLLFTCCRLHKLNTSLHESQWYLNTLG